MSAWWTVLCKEIIENLRDRRAMASALLYGPLVGPVLFATMLTLILGQQRQAAEKPLELPVAGAEHAPELLRWLRAQGVQVLDAPADPEQAIREQRHDVLLSIPDSYPQAWREGEPARVDLLMDGSRQAAQTQVARADALLQRYARQTGLLRLQVRGIAPQLSAPVIVAHRDLSTPQSRSVLLLSMLPYFLILSAFIGGMYLAIDCTAGERERQSLEPLLMTAAPRDQLLWGKWLATASFAGASLLICVLAFAVSMRMVPTAGLGIDLRLPLSAVALIALLVLPVALLASGVQLLVASFAKSFREAQTYLQFLILVPAVPSVIVAINPVKLEAWMAAVPLLSQSLLITAVARGEVPPALTVLLSLFTTGAAGALFTAVAVRLFRREAFALGA